MFAWARFYTWLCCTFPPPKIACRGKLGTAPPPPFSHHPRSDVSLACRRTYLDPAANFYVCVLTGVSFSTRFSTRLRQVLFGGWKVGALIVFAYVILNQKGSQTR